MEVDGRTGQADPNFALPAALTRRFEVCIRPRDTAKHARLREVGAAQIGHLVTFRGIVTQVTDVRPLLTIATYLDDQTGFEIYQEVGEAGCAARKGKEWMGKALWAVVRRI